MADIKNTAQSRVQLAAAAAGNVVENFDWLIYAILAPYFSNAMFPGADPAARLLATYLVFAVGFLVRPVGAIVMGRLADRKGRRYALIASIWMISAGSLVIGLTPDHDSIGIAASVIVVLARLVQGLSMSGEQAAATTYIFETAPPRRRYLYGAIASASGYLGQMLATLCLAVLVATFGHEWLASDGWRVGFLVAAALGLIGLWLRKAAPESEVFEKQVGSVRHPQLPVLMVRKRQIISLFLLVIPSTMGLYFVTAFMAVYLEGAGAATRQQVTTWIPLFVCYLLFVILLAGWLADRWGGLRLIRAGHALLALATVPLIEGMALGQLPVVPATMAYLSLLGIVTGPFAMIGPQIFPPAVRAVGMGVPTMTAVAAFGGTFLVVAQSLNASGNISLLPWYLGLGALAGLVGSVTVHAKDFADTAFPVDSYRTLAGPKIPIN